MTWTADHHIEAAGHLNALARRHRIGIYWVEDKRKWQAHEDSRQVWAPPPSDAHRYLVGLHELGHVVSRVARRWSNRYGEPGAMVLVEGAAWSWAAQAARPSLVAESTPSDWDAVTSLFGDYLWTAAMLEPEPVGQQRRL